MRVIGAFAGLGLLSLVSCTGTEAATPAAPEAAADAAFEAQSAPQVAAEPMLPPAPAPAPIQADFLFLAGELTQGGFVRGQVPTGTTSVTLGERRVAVAEDGMFFAAFDRDSPASVTLTAMLENGETVREELTLSQRTWQRQNLNIARRPGGPSASFMARRQPQIDAINAARAKQTGAQGWRQDFIWPVKGRISSPFGVQRFYRGEKAGYHRGIDIAPGNGVPFVAPADGVVVLAGTDYIFEGGLIIIDHGAGLNSAFLHASRIVVKVGDEVRQGQHIGNVGSTGRSTGPHLDWGLWWNGARFDGRLLAGPMN